MLGLSLGLVLLAATFEGVSVLPFELPSPLPGLALAPCHLDGLAEGVLCGVHQVFENRATNTGRQIDIHVAVLPALRRGTEPDPLLVFAGGPGQGARGFAAVAARFFRAIRRHRDIVLIDLRGTGASSPLKCPKAGDEIDELDTAGPRAAIAACLATLPGDPRFYTHQESLADVDDIRQRLGIERVNLWGGSWGTRAALLYAARFPNAVRSAVLDGAVPLDLDFPQTASADAQRALTLLLDTCRSHQDCRQRFPDPEGDLAAIDRQLQGGPVRASIRHPRTGKPASIDLTRDVAFDILRGALYVPRDAAAVLPIVQAAARGDWGPLVTQFLRTASVSTDDMALGATLSVLCSEDLPLSDGVDFGAGARGSLFGTGYANVWRERCQLWPRGAPLSVDRHVRVDAPALILSGLHDPVTPPRTGEAMARHFVRSWHVVVPAAAHNASFTGCVPELIEQFIADGHGDGLDTACVTSAAWPPIAMTTAGTLP
jgi:pimeloyl-ACP methyl ester carboxylesterase